MKLSKIPVLMPCENAFFVTVLFVWVFPKIVGKPPKMDGEKKWKTLLKWMIWGETHYFRKHPYIVLLLGGGSKHFLGSPMKQTTSWFCMAIASCARGAGTTSFSN